MATNARHINRRGALRRTLLVLLVAAGAAILAARDGDGYAAKAQSQRDPDTLTIVSRSWSAPASVRAAYGWPLKPFDRPHPVRAYLNDPRILGSARSFHFGIDIGIPLGRLTPVYAVEPGRVQIVNAFAVAVQASHTFAYWHVTPVVRSGQQVGRHQLLGLSLKGWNHIHFAEYAGGSWLNPLRPGALGPFVDHTVPTLRSVAFKRNGRPLNRNHVYGSWSIELVAYDTAATITPAPWPVTPALISWRIVQGQRPVTGWRTVLESHTTLPKETFSSVYAPGTAQNHPGHPGVYRFYLARAWSSTSLPSGTYQVEIRVADIRSNSVLGRIGFTVDAN